MRFTRDGVWTSAHNIDRLSWCNYGEKQSDRAKTD
ncbi:hypothetical protein SAMN06297468_0007 [Altererythrobacter xiamenensis]|uniref:Uncharacterized protein n=1 Tax=Altererythrobacter xiamenensis TaxID=1316679 RepID=A0A1Y6E4S7_9SPHN|nr:hypothetical protein SAMN06297468_0007 [Altererythrobacter xiamenensis]